MFTCLHNWNTNRSESNQITVNIITYIFALDTTVPLAVA
jgi:hypothetical protein